MGPVNRFKLVTNKNRPKQSFDILVDSKPIAEAIYEYGLETSRLMWKEKARCTVSIANLLESRLKPGTYPILMSSYCLEHGGADAADIELMPIMVEHETDHIIWNISWVDFSPPSDTAPMRLVFDKQEYLNAITLLK